MLIDLDCLVTALRKRNDLWHDLASALNIAKDQLDMISSQCQSDFDALVEVCDAWLKMLSAENTLPTWQAVIVALEEIGAKELAEELTNTSNSAPAESKGSFVEMGRLSQ